jgi:hypothetical protein
MGRYLSFDDNLFFKFGQFEGDVRLEILQNTITSLELKPIIDQEF